ncbi:concanavalin A-like lectin/glucanase domain-containing protein [Coemansia spiralis]|nr:concanavalin A-like lectin/glucanase domain-containing protein [Coemansia spiralis]
MKAQQSILQSNWIQYGTITARILSGSTTPGVVSSLQLQDDSGSVIDMDWVGASPEAVQANYYVSNQVEPSQAVAQALPNDPTNSFITYKIIWTPDSLTWYANGLAIRTVSREDTWAEGEQQFKYPSSPSRLSFSIWDAANSINPGETQEWAGRIPDNSTTTQFTMAIGMVSIQCYSNTTNTDSNSNSGTAASATQNMSNFVSSKPVVNVDLSNFGLASGVSSSPSPSSSLTSSTGAADNNELSQWLADMSMTSSGAWLAQTLGIATSVLFTFGVAIISHI